MCSSHFLEMDAKSATRLSAIVIFLSPVLLLALSPTLPVESPSSQQTVSNQERKNGWKIEANRGNVKILKISDKTFLIQRPVLLLSDLLPNESSYDQVVPLVNVHIHIISLFYQIYVWLTLCMYLQDRPPLFKGHPALVFLHITLLMMDSFDQVLISTLASLPMLL